MLSSVLMLTVVLSNPVQQPAFIVVNEANATHHKVIDNDAVIAFAQTPQGRVLFSSFGAFVGVPQKNDTVAVMQVGFSKRKHKRGLMPEWGPNRKTKIHRMGGASQTWQKNMKAPRDLTYRSVWPGIDLTFLTKGSQLEFQLTLIPGADPESIELTTGATALEIMDGALLASMDEANLRLSPPQAFQTINGKQITIPVNYRILENGKFGFELGAYDRAFPLVIDPLLSWSTLFGGQGGEQEEEGVFAIAVNDQQQAIVGGETKAPDFPTTPGVFAENWTMQSDLFVGKISTDGTSFEFMTFIGSTGDDYMGDLEVDASGNIFITGKVSSADFPTTPGAFDRIPNGNDAFLTKLNGDGTALEFSTFLGGSGSDEGETLVLLPDGSTLLFAKSNSADMPVTANAIDDTANGGNDIFITQISADGSQVLFGTYFGGNGSDQRTKALRMADGRIAFAGQTVSPDLPTTPGAFAEADHGEQDIFMAIMAADFSAFSQVTYLGGTDPDSPTGLGVDALGNLVVAGWSESSDFPATAGAFDTNLGGSRDGVVAKLSSDLSTLVASTFLGVSRGESIDAMAMDALGQPVVAGLALFDSFPVTSGAFDETYNGKDDIFVTQFNADLSDIVFSTFLGGTDDDLVGDIVVDSSGAVYVAGTIDSVDFPLTTGVRGGDQDGFVTKLASDGSSLAYSMPLGGNGRDVSRAIALTPAGEIVIVGETHSANFPITPGVFDATNAKGDAFVSKFDATGTHLLFSTYLGGSGNDVGIAVDVDSLGHILVAGETDSKDFPTTAGAFDEVLDDVNGLFLAKLTPAGDGLVFGTYLEGSSNDELGGLVVAGDNSIYVAGSTNSGNFPVTPGAFSEMRSGTVDGFLTRFSADGSTLMFGTYFGGPAFEQIKALGVDALNQAVVGGETRGVIPTTPGALSEALTGFSDGFVTKFTSAGDALVFSTYLGSTGSEDVVDLVLDESGNVHVCGDVLGNAPVTPDAIQSSSQGSRDVYVASLSADGTQLLYGSHLGGSGTENPCGIALDPNGDIMVTGETGSTDFPVAGPSLQSHRRGFSDGFLTLFGCSGTELQYSSYVGGNSADYNLAIAADDQGMVFIFGSTFSTDFVTTEGVFDDQYDRDVELFLSAFDFRSENLTYPEKSVYVQGLENISLEAILPSCPVDALDVQWFNETEGKAFPVNTNPIVLSPFPSQSLSMRLEITNTVTQEMRMEQVGVLISQNPLYFDLNGDGCNDPGDILAMAPLWGASISKDPNEDGVIDVRDFLYINVDNQGNCP